MQAEQLIVKDTTTEKEYKVTVVHQNGANAEIKGLPVKLSAFLFNFTDSEIVNDTVDVINVLITMYDSRSNGTINIVQELPSEKEFKE